jgi:hypothetical protein
VVILYVFSWSIIRKLIVKTRDISIYLTFKFVYWVVSLWVWDSWIVLEFQVDLGVWFNSLRTEVFWEKFEKFVCSPKMVELEKRMASSESARQKLSNELSCQYVSTIFKIVLGNFCVNPTLGDGSHHWWFIHKETGSVIWAATVSVSVSQSVSPFWIRNMSRLPSTLILNYCC